METFDLTQTGAQVQDILDKAAQLPSKATLDTELNAKADKSNTYTKAEVDQLVQTLENGSYERVDTYEDLGDPTEEKAGIIWLVGAEDAEEFDRYIIGKSGDTYEWVYMGTTSVDLTGKADKVADAVDGDLAGLDSDGNLTDSGYKPADFATAAQGEKADTAYQLPGSGIPEEDLSTPVQNALGRIDNKADKVGSGHTDKLASFNSAGNLKDSGIPTNMVALVLGRYMKMISGAAETLINPNKVNASFLRRITGGALGTVGSGPAVIKRMGGVSRVFNQLVKNGNFADSSEWYASVNASSSVANGECSVTSTGTLTGIRQSSSVINGHKYFIRASVKGAEGGEAVRIGVQSTGITLTGTATTSYVEYSGIFTANAAGTIVEVSTTNATIVVKNVVLTDLTQLFNGSVPEGYTVADFVRDYPLLYYAATTGKVLPFAAQNLETTGPQQWDEDWEYGSISTTDGSPVPSTAVFRSKNFCSAIGNTEYSLYYGSLVISQNVMYVFWYDASKNFISSTSTSSITQVVTSPANACFFKVRNGGTQPMTGGYMHNMCVSISNPATNGKYYPYNLNTLAVNPGAWQDTDGNLVYPGGGMQGLGAVQDFAEAESDGFIRKANVVYDRVNLGDLTWVKGAASTSSLDLWVSSADALHRNASSVAAVCDRFRFGGLISSQSSALSAGDNAFCLYSAEAAKNAVVIVQAAGRYADATAFGNAMDGVYLYFEADTPFEKTLKTPVPAIYIENANGTEAWTPDNTSDPYTSPCDIDIQYPFDAVGMLLGLAQKFISGASLDNALTAMCTALGTVSYDPTAKVWDETTKAWTYDAAFTAVEPTDNEE